MSLLAYLISAVIILTTYIIVTRKSRMQRKRIAQAVDQFNGAKWYPIVGTTLEQIFTAKEDLLRSIQERPKKYGPIYRSWVGGLPVIHLTKAKDAEVILRSSTHITKPRIYEFIRPFLGDGLVTGQGAQWKMHRKFITPTFHFKILDNFQDVFAEKAQILASELLDPLANGEFFDVNPHITLCALDIICETAMGVEIDAMRHFESEYIQALCAVTKCISHRWFRPWLHPNLFFKYSPVGKKQANLLRIIHEFGDRVIRERRQLLENSVDDDQLSEEDREIGKKTRMAFLDLLLKQNQFTDKEIREEVDTFMFGGHDTTTVATSWTLFALGSHPEVQAKVHEEIDSIFQGEERKITSEDVAKLNYMERVLKETMRVHTLVPCILRHLTEDVILDGKLVPAGVTLAIHLDSIHKDPEQFPDPERFDPDRFLPENVAKRNPYAHIPFSAGPRNCIGQKFAMRNTKTLLATLLRKFRVRSQEKPDKIKYYGDIVLKPHKGMFLSLERRNKE